jgi:hypothetical protein
MHERQGEPKLGVTNPPGGQVVVLREELLALVGEDRGIGRVLELDSETVIDLGLGVPVSFEHLKNFGEWRRAAALLLLMEPVEGRVHRRPEGLTLGEHEPRQPVDVLEAVLQRTGEIELDR